MFASSLVAALPPQADLSWLGWVLIGVMILLQLIILLVIAGRPRAVAVLGFGLPIMCGVCAVTATEVILYHMERGGLPSELVGFRHPLFVLLFVVWAICGIVALVTVILCVIPLRRRTAPLVAPGEEKPPAPSVPEVSRTKT